MEESRTLTLLHGELLLPYLPSLSPLQSMVLRPQEPPITEARVSPRNVGCPPVAMGSHERSLVPPCHWLRICTPRAQLQEPQIPPDLS